MNAWSTEDTVEKKINFIDDEVVFEATCNPTEPAFAPITFKYRPPLGDHKAAFLDAVAQGIGSTQRAAPQLLRQHLMSWDVKDSRGRDVLIRADTVTKIPPTMQIAMAMLIIESADQVAEAAKNS